MADHTDDEYPIIRKNEGQLGGPSNHPLIPFKSAGEIIRQHFSQKEVLFNIHPRDVIQIEASDDNSMMMTMCRTEIKLWQISKGKHYQVVSTLTYDKNLSHRIEPPCFVPFFDTRKALIVNRAEKNVGLLVDFNSGEEHFININPSLSHYSFEYGSLTYSEYLIDWENNNFIPCSHAEQKEAFSSTLTQSVIQVISKNNRIEKYNLKKYRPGDRNLLETKFSLNFTHDYFVKMNHLYSYNPNLEIQYFGFSSLGEYVIVINSDGFYVMPVFLDKNRQFLIVYSGTFYPILPAAGLDNSVQISNAEKRKLRKKIEKLTGHRKKTDFKDKTAEHAPFAYTDLYDSIVLKCGQYHEMFDDLNYTLLTYHKVFPFICRIPDSSYNPDYINELPDRFGLRCIEEHNDWHSNRKELLQFGLQFRHSMLEDNMIISIRSSSLMHPDFSYVLSNDSIVKLRDRMISADKTFFFDSSDWDDWNEFFGGSIFLYDLNNRKLNKSLCLEQNQNSNERYLEHNLWLTVWKGLTDEYYIVAEDGIMKVETNNDVTLCSWNTIFENSELFDEYYGEDKHYLIVNGLCYGHLSGEYYCHIIYVAHRYYLVKFNYRDFCVEWNGTCLSKYYYSSSSNTYELIDNLRDRVDEKILDCNTEENLRCWVKDYPSEPINILCSDKYYLTIWDDRIRCVDIDANRIIWNYTEFHNDDEIPQYSYDQSVPDIILIFNPIRGAIDFIDIPTGSLLAYAFIIEHDIIIITTPDESKKIYYASNLSELEPDCFSFIKKDMLASITRPLDENEIKGMNNPAAVYARLRGLEYYKQYQLTKDRPTGVGTTKRLTGERRRLPGNGELT